MLAAAIFLFHERALLQAYRHIGIHRAYTMHIPCTYHAHTMHIPCIRHTYIPCIHHAHHAYTTHIAFIVHTPCIYHLLLLHERALLQAADSDNARHPNPIPTLTLILIRRPTAMTRGTLTLSLTRTLILIRRPTAMTRGTCFSTQVAQQSSRWRRCCKPSSTIHSG
jgi:hypothetical protein